MSDRFLTGTRKGLFVYEKSGRGWSVAHRAFEGVRVPMALADPRDGSIYAAVDHGHFGSKMHRSRDGGATWEELPAPAWPPKPEEAAPVLDPMRGTEVPWSLELVWSLEAGGADEPGVLWCGTIPGGLFKSEDHGASWSLVRSLWDRPERAQWFGGGYDHPGIHSICVHPQNSKQVTIAVSCGGVWRTEDGGDSWNLLGKGLLAGYMPPEKAEEPGVQDPHRMVACPGTPDVMWIQHHSGVFRSSNGGVTWQKIEGIAPSDFGFAVAVHPREADTAWLVPAMSDEKRIPCGGRVTVSRTRDGGRTFESFGEGLPAEDAWHLIYRHSLEVDSSGKRLVMGSTTGSLWISEDACESWSRLSAELPPVFCVRWI